MKKLKVVQMEDIQGGDWSWEGCAAGAGLTFMNAAPFAAILGGPLGVGILSGIGCLAGGWT